MRQPVYSRLEEGLLGVNSRPGINPLVTLGLESRFIGEGKTLEYGIDQDAYSDAIRY